MRLLYVTLTTKIFILQYCAMRRNFIIVNEDILAKTISYSISRFYLFFLQIIFRCYTLKQIDMIYYNILFFILQAEWAVYERTFKSSGDQQDQ